MGFSGFWSMLRQERFLGVTIVTCLIFVLFREPIVGHASTSWVAAVELTWLFAVILGTGLALRRNWLGAVLSEALPMTELGWRKLTVRMTVFLVLLALSNEIVWRTQSESTWVWFETFGLPAALFVFLMANAGLYSAHALPPAETSDDDRAV